MARVLTVTLNPALDLTVQLPALRLGEVNRSESLQVHAAGKGLNVAQVLADLGHQLTVSGEYAKRSLQTELSVCLCARKLRIEIEKGGRQTEH